PGRAPATWDRSAAGADGAADARAGAHVDVDRGRRARGRLDGDGDAGHGLAAGLERDVLDLGARLHDARHGRGYILAGAEMDLGVGRVRAMERYLELLDVGVRLALGHDADVGSVAGDVRGAPRGALELADRIEAGRLEVARALRLLDLGAAAAVA